MASNLASINILFRVDTRSLSTGLQNSIRTMNQYGTAMQDVGKSLMYNVTLPIAAVGLAALTTFGSIDSLNRGLNSVTGSAIATSVEFSKLKEVAKLPGLGLEESVRGSVNLQAAGFSANFARRSLLSFGNALATVGKGKAELDRVNVALTQLNNKTSGYGQDIRQLTEQLPQLRTALMAAFGTSDSEAISKLGFTGTQVIEKLVTEFEKLPKVTGGINNAFENTSDAIKLSLAGLGESINKAFNVEGLLNSVAESASGMADSFSNTRPAFQGAVLGFAGVAAATGPVLFAVGGLIKAWPLLITGLNGVKTAFAGLQSAALSPTFLAIASAATVGYLAYKVFSGEAVKLTAVQQTLADVNLAAAKSVSAERAQVDKLLSIARSEYTSKKDKLEAIKEINKISPEYMGNITLETINTNETKIAIDNYVESLNKKAKAQASDAKRTELFAARAEEELRAVGNAAEMAKAVLADKSFLKIDIDPGQTIVRSRADLEEYIKTIGLTAKQAEVLRVFFEKSFKDKERELALIDSQIAAVNKLSGATKSSTVETKAGAEATAKTIEYYEDLISKLEEANKKTETSAAGIKKNNAEIQKMAR